MFKEVFLALIESIDIFLAAAALGNSAIRIPLRSAMLISSVSTAVMGVSVKFSALLGEIMPAVMFHRCEIALLTAIGLLTIMKSIIRNIVRKLSEKGGLSLKTEKGSLVVRLYLDDTAADIDNSKVLSLAEAFTLALAGSFDAAATGLGSGGCGIDLPTIIGATFVCGCTALLLGSLIGRRISRLERDYSWIGGILLITFAFFV